MSENLFSPEQVGRIFQNPGLLDQAANAVAMTSYLLAPNVVLGLEVEGCALAPRVAGMIQSLSRQPVRFALDLGSGTDLQNQGVLIVSDDLPDQKIRKGVIRKIEKQGGRVLGFVALRSSEKEEPQRSGRFPTRETDPRIEVILNGAGASGRT